MWGQRKDDVESGRQPLYPMMVESPELRWSFVRKIYSIVSIQLLLTIAVAAVVVTVHPISVFFSTTKVGLVLYILLVITPFIGRILSDSFDSVELNRSFLVVRFLFNSFWIFFWFVVLCPLYSYYRSHPLNYILLGLFTVSLAFAVGLTCSYTNGERFILCRYFLNCGFRLRFSFVRIFYLFIYELLRFSCLLIFGKKSVLFINLIFRDLEFCLSWRKRENTGGGDCC